MLELLSNITIMISSIILALASNYPMEIYHYMEDGTCVA
jgi:hypothetical protein